MQAKTVFFLPTVLQEDGDIDRRTRAGRKIDRAKHDPDGSPGLVGSHRQTSMGNCRALRILLADGPHLQLKLGHTIFRHGGGANRESDDDCFSGGKVKSTWRDRDPLRRHAFDEHVNVIFIRVLVQNGNIECDAGFWRHRKLFLFGGNFELIILTLLKSIIVHHRSFNSSLIHHLQNRRICISHSILFEI